MKREPKQERSKQIVNAVLAGATRVLMKMRLKEATTNKIAEVAGVGIGSLYDYFPNKEAIVTSLIDRRIESLTADFRQLLAANEGNTPEEKLEEVVSFFQENFLARKDFLREVFQLAPVTGRMEVIYQARVANSELVSAYLQKKFPGLEKSEANRHAFLMLHGSLGLVESYVMVNPDYFSPEELATELRRLLKIFLPRAPR